MTVRSDGNHNVLLIQRIVPPYRLPVFQRLANCEFTLTVAFGVEPHWSSLKSVRSIGGVETIMVKNISVARDFIVVQRGVLGLVCSRRYDTVIAELNPRVVSNIIACIAASLLGVRFIWWGHGLPPDGRYGWANRTLRVLLANLGHAIILYDGVRAEALISSGLRRKAFVAWNSIDTDTIASLVRENPFTSRWRIVYVGRLIPEKKVDVLLRAFAQVYVGLPSETGLTLIGDGPCRAELGRLAETLGITQQVAFIGELTDERRLAELFNSAWVSVSPGYIGLAAIHSLAYGLPMIVADNEPHSPEIAAIEFGANALRFKSGDSKDLADQLLLLSNDRERAYEMGQRGRDRIRRTFSLEAMARAFSEAVSHVHGDENRGAGTESKGVIESASAFRTDL